MPSPPILTGVTLPPAPVGYFYYYAFEVTGDSGGSGTFVFSVASGLPPGLDLDTDSGALSGFPTTSGTYTFIVHVQDTSTGQSGSGTFHLIVSGTGSGGGSSFSIATTALPDGAVGVSYSQPVATANGTSPITFSIGAGLTPGLAIDAGTGEITGVPTAVGVSTFVVEATDANLLTASATLTITVPSNPSIANSSLPMGQVGIPYNASLVGKGGAQPYGFAVVAGSLAPGQRLASTGGITGTPTVAGSFSVTIQITDSSAPAGSSTATFTIVITSAAIANAVGAMDDVVLLACEDGGVYAIVPGQRHDENYAGQPVGFLQKWNGVTGNLSPGMPVLQLGGATISAKGNGLLNVVATDNVGTVTHLTTDNRPMILTGGAEVVRDLGARAVPHSERYGVGFDNGGVADAWFEVHGAILWVRKIASSRKA